MKLPFHYIRHAQKTFDHFHRNMHHAFVIIVWAIIGMLRWASHLFLPTHATRQRWGFITSDFRYQSPSQWNIKYALFGDGTPWSTAYTNIWNSSCIPTNPIQYISSLSWTTLSDNTIYVVNSGTYTLTSPLIIGNCSAIIWIGEVVINANGYPIEIQNGQNIIIDNIAFDGQNTVSQGIIVNTWTNITFNGIDVYHNTWYGIYTTNTNNILFDNSNIYDNSSIGIAVSNNTTINNSKIYNNSEGLVINQYSNNTINNSQIYNNTKWVRIGYYTSTPMCPVNTACVRCSTIDLKNTINNTIIYNNDNGIYIDKCLSMGNQSYDFNRIYYLNDTKIYNNGTWIAEIANFGSGFTMSYYWTLRVFGNDVFTWGVISHLTPGLLPSPVTTRSAWSLDATPTSMTYDRVTNPQNGSWQWMLNGILTELRGIQTFDVTRPIRYIFWLNISKQIVPVRFNSSSLEAYGSDGAEYFTTKYITEPSSILSFNQQNLVQQYFWSWSAFTENRETNWCSLSAFQVKELTGGTFSSTYAFEDHTIYILTGGEYRSALSLGYPFVFNGNCIALVGTDTTRFTKNGWSGILGMLYADNKHNIIIDNIKVDAEYYGTNSVSWPAAVGIKLDGASNNNTLNNIQVYNTSEYGIYLGLGSHHNTIINAQIFNHALAGIYLYYASNYNVINNTQVYNNTAYGIWFANGSSKNTMNNFQAYNNQIGIFWDLTTKENVLNRAAIYNNSEAGIYFKNASGNALNDVMIYNNTKGIKALYSSNNNKYYGELKFFANTSDLDGTDANDGYLAPGTAGLFPYEGTLITGTTAMSCLYATNPTRSGDSITLLNSSCNNSWYNSSFISQYNTYTNYMFGLGIYKQSIPIRYESGNTQPVQIPSQYDANKYIAELFAIRDTYPEYVGFASTGSAPLNSWYTTEVYTAGTVNIPVLATLSFEPSTTSWYLIISWTTLTTLTGMVNNGDPIQVKLLTQPWYNQTITGTITIGTAPTATFTITTRDYSQTPATGSFAFANFTSIPLDTFTGSTVTIAGIETGVLASIAFVPTTTSWRLEIYSWGILVNSWTTGLLVHNGNQIKAIAQSSSGYSQTVTGYVTIGLWTGMFTIKTKWSDVTPPTAPTLTYPLTGEELFFVTWEWTGATDTGSGIEGYVYQIAEDSSFTDIVDTGFIATTGTFGRPSTAFDATSDTFYRRLQARDRDGNLSSRSNAGRFEAIDSDERNFDEIENANLRTYYDSNEITLEGIKDGLSLQATIDNNGTLYENENEKGTGTLIQNDDTLFINLRSSNRYDKTVSSILTIANRELEFTVTTKEQSDDGCTLNEDDETTIQDIFDGLVENYSWDENMYEEFLYTMQSMLEDEIDFTNDCNLQYLQDLINDEIWITPESPTATTGAHIAPNCKQYTVAFDTTRSAYSSPNFKVVTYFANRDALTRYIDSKNPGDCHITTYGVSSWIFTNTDPTKHIAANGKIYTVQTSPQGWYTSSDFSSAKYFSTLNALRAYIDTNNPPPEVWNHQVDTSFSPQVYTAPNGKEYTIYHTNRGYMSYKLMKVRYFSTLAELQAYIQKNNTR